ncbi:11055_t:CDS:1 [Ambispora gerdemannii]|uniref:11055_t:CDS:1 n=1 Tax=Ambispora gerdemannii TaxID=144530 RepID=A0A9N9BYH8_9GLOM|nr:11055_t:CDS:1 [Ambispora gerdemannii]
MTKRINLYFVLALIFAFSFASANGASLWQRTWPQKTARAAFRLGTGCSLVGDIDFFQSSEEYVRFSGQINQGFDWSDPNEYQFEIRNGGTPEILAFPTFTVNAPPGGSSDFHIIDENKVIGLAGGVAARNVLGHDLKIFHLSSLLCSAEIKGAP